MKKTILLTFLWLLMLSLGVVQAQVTEDEEDILLEREEDRIADLAHDRTFKLHPLQLDEIYLSYEKVRTARVSNEFGLGYVYSGNLKGSGWIPESKDAAGIAIRMSQRHYTSKKRTAPFGFFHGPVFGYRFLVFEENVFGLEELPPNDPDYEFVGRLYQNSLDLLYQVGWQFTLGRHFTLDMAGGLGGRIKYARAAGGREHLESQIPGHILMADANSVVAALPLPQLKIAVGYSF